MPRPPVSIHPAALMDAESKLLYADDGADLERRAVRENVVAVDHAPFITPWRGTQMRLVVIDPVAAIPVFVVDDRASLPFSMLDVSVVVAMVPVLGDGDAPHKSGGKDRKG
jgi:hypothetical protein